MSLANRALWAALLAGGLTLAAYSAFLLTNGSFDITRSAPQLIDQIPFSRVVIGALGVSAFDEMHAGRWAYGALFAALLLALFGFFSLFRAPPQVAPMVSAVAEPTLPARLERPGQRRDAWARFMGKVAFIGREAELERLEAFRRGPDRFAWQVLFGPHAVGKSRLAQEWLATVEKGASDWTVGFANDVICPLGELTNFKPLGPTIIVIDQAGTLGPALWTFIERAQAQWSDSPGPIRILLIAHTDLLPEGQSFDRTEQLIEARESEFIVARHEGGGSERVSKQGIELRPIADDQQRARLVALSAQAAGVEVSAARAIALVSETGGRPAFLVLAGRYPDAWRTKLVEYARDLVATATRLFPDAPEDGVVTLLVSALIGPAPQSVRATLAPKANAPEKLAELLGVGVADVRASIPAFEPDLLAQEVVFEALAHIDIGRRQSVCDALAIARPAAFLDKTLSMWERHGTVEGVLARLSGKGAGRLDTLELLFDSAAEAGVRTVNSPFWKVYSARGQIYCDALLAEAAPTASDCAGLVKEALRHVADDAAATYLRDLAADAPCDQTNRLKWGALLIHYIGKSSRTPEAIAPFALTKGVVNESVASELIAGMDSPQVFERAYACFRLAEALRNRKAPAADIIASYGDVFGRIQRLIRRPAGADRTAAAFALTYIVRSPDGRPGRELLGEGDTEALHAIVADRRSSEDERQSAVYALVHAWKSSYRQSELSSVLGHAQPCEVLFSPSEQEQRAATTRLFTLALERLEGDAGWPGRGLARACLSLDTVTAATRPLLIAQLRDATVSVGDRVEVVLRTMRVEPSIAAVMLSEAAVGGDADMQALAAACLARIGAIDELERLEVRALERISGFDLTAFAQYARERDPQSPWEGRESRILVSRMQDMHIRISGDLIHKLKAKDTTGRWAYYFVLVEAEHENEFLGAIEGDGIIDLEKYGKVIASCYGEAPTQAIKDFLKERYGFEV